MRAGAWRCCSGLGRARGRDKGRACIHVLPSRARGRLLERLCCYPILCVSLLVLHVAGFHAGDSKYDIEDADDSAMSGKNSRTHYRVSMGNVMRMMNWSHATAVKFNVT